MRGLKGTVSWMMRGIYMPPASNGSSRLWMMVGGGSGFKVLSLGGLKAGSVEEAVARITGEADDRGAEGKKGRMVRIRMVARIRAGGRDDESSTAYYAYVDGERNVLSKNPHLLLRMAGARKYQQVFGKHGFDYIMDCEVFGVSRRAHDSPLYRVKSLPNRWYGWCIDVKYLVDGWMVMPRAWERLEKFMKWKYKRKYGRLPSGEELKKVKSGLYVSEMIKRIWRGPGHAREVM
jgi:hypothetical protein